MLKRYLKIFAAPLCLSLIGCVTPKTYSLNDTVNIPQNALNAMPRYSVGDEFVFATGSGGSSTERVVSVSGNKVMWKRGRNLDYTSLRSFFLPDFEFESSTAHTVRKLDIDNPGILWPLAPGKKSGWFTAYYTYTDKKTGAVRQGSIKYTCRVGDYTTLAVQAGRFRTLPVTCDKYSATGWPYGKTTWYYAPAVGHYVFIKGEPAFSKSNPWSRELRSFQKATVSVAGAMTPDRPQFELYVANYAPDVRENIVNMIRLALQNNLNDQKTEFMPRRGAQIVSWPRTVRKQGDGTWCRDFTVSVRYQRQSADYSGLACKLDGTWTVMRP